MFRTIVSIVSSAAALATGSLVGAGAASAQPVAAYYTATPAAAPARTSFITGETVWTWRDSAYTARRGDARDTIQCELVVRRAGKLNAFSAGGTAFDASQLERCNAKAR